MLLVFPTASSAKSDNLRWLEFYTIFIESEFSLVFIDIIRIAINL